MPSSWPEKLGRVIASGALLLLLAAQEKVCPWLLTPPVDEPAEQADAPHPADADAEKDAPQPVPLNLHHVLPDAMPVRWSGVPGRAALDEACGWRAGAVARGAERGAAPAGEALPEVACDWRRWLRPARRPVAPQPATVVDGHFLDPALFSVVWQTGPPVG